MLTTMVIVAMMTAFISMFCVFVTAPHFCGAYFYARGAAGTVSPSKPTFSWTNGIKSRVCPQEQWFSWTNPSSKGTYLD